MIVTETEYADIHNVKRGTVGSWIARGEADRGVPR